MTLERLTKITSVGISSGIQLSDPVFVGVVTAITLNVTSAGANFAGVVTASSFVGDGSGLTGVVGSGSGVIVRDSGALVGTAGTIDFGSNLSVSPIFAGIVTVTGTDTNTTYTQAAVASGSNVNIRLSGSDSTTDDILLTAGSNVTFSSVTASGFTINSSGSGGGSSSQFGETAAGIHTLSNVGIGTTNPTSKLTVTGNALVTGVVTATTFVGALTGTASNVTTNANLTGDVTSTGNATSIAAGVIVDADINASAAIALSKLATTGTLTATSFVGDGSGLTGVVGSGSGVIVRDSGALVGTAGTIDFGDNLTVSPISAGIVTVTGSSIVIQEEGSSVGTATTINFVGTAVTATFANGVATVSITGGGSGVGTDTLQSVSDRGNTTTQEITASNFRSNDTVGDGTDVGFAIKYYITANGASAYRFAGPGVLNSTDNPTLYLHRGFTYIFENSTGGSHPFAIRTSSGGSAYTSAFLSGSQTGTQIFTVPFDAPNTLVYQCTIHSAMVGTLNIVS